MKETITILTAEAARAITKDIIHNEAGEQIPIIANAIKEAAYHGLSSASVKFSKDIAYEPGSTLINFFRQLGYKAERQGQMFYIRW